MAKTRRVWGGYICNDLINQTGDAVQSSIREIELLSAKENPNCEDVHKCLCKVMAFQAKAGVAILTLRDMFRENHLDNGK